jgi:hypothetical protein
VESLAITGQWHSVAVPFFIPGGCYLLIAIRCWLFAGGQDLIVICQQSTVSGQQPFVNGQSTNCQPPFVNGQLPVVSCRGIAGGW